MNRINKKGFTLVELLISISMIIIIEGAMLKLLEGTIKNNSLSSARTKVVSAAQGVMEICKCTSAENLIDSLNGSSDKSIVCFYNSDSDTLYETFKNYSTATDGINTEPLSILKEKANKSYDVVIKAIISVYGEEMAGITVTAWDKKYGEKCMVKLVTIRRKDI